MKKIKFEKVSEEQFVKDCKKLFPKMSLKKIKAAYNNLVIPERGTKGSCGYDIRSPFDFLLSCLEGPVTFPTGLRVKMPRKIFLMVVPRSGIGFKTGVALANTVGIIDSDYFYSDNEGHIMVKLVPGYKDLAVKAGDRVVQGIFLQYFITDDDKTKGKRKGGFGSTGVK